MRLAAARSAANAAVILQPALLQDTSLSNVVPEGAASPVHCSS